jgi:hypothetical protein
MSASRLDSQALEGILLEPGVPGYDAEVAGFNSAVVHRPAFVVAAASTAQVADAVRFARERGLSVGVHNTGHGVHRPFDKGLLINTRRIDRVEVDGAARAVTAGAGARWGALIASAAPHGLAPIAGSSPTVGVVGLLLGGGIGPLVRSHGFASDYLAGATLVTGNGDVVETSAGENPDILWALRGGKPRLGVVTAVRLRLAEVPLLYAGSLFFAEEQIEAALRTWIDWTAQAPPQVTSSAAIVRFPPLEAVPPPLRGRRLLTVRFAYPGEPSEGARLAAPLRSSAPVHLDSLAVLPVADIARIFNDPPGPLPAWTSAGLLTGVDQELASVLLRHLGAGTDSPFVAVEVRHLGAATARDVPGGSAAGGRGAHFAFGVVGTNPACFAEVFPEAETRLVGDLAPWLSPEANGNFTPHPGVHRPIKAALAPRVQAKLDELARTHDPRGLFG